MSSVVHVEQTIKCWFCLRRVRAGFSHDISLCRACGLFLQRWIIQRWDGGWWRCLQLWVSLYAYRLAMRLSRHPEYDR